MLFRSTTQSVATSNVIGGDDSKYATYSTDSTYGSTYTAVDSTDTHGQSSLNSHPNSYGNHQFQEINPNLNQNQNLNHDSYNSNPYNNQNQNVNPNQNSFHPDLNYNNNMIRQDFSNMGMRKTFIRGKTWEEKKSLVQSMSAFGHLPGNSQNIVLYCIILFPFIMFLCLCYYLRNYYLFLVLFFFIRLIIHCLFV